MAASRSATGLSQSWLPAGTRRPGNHRARARAALEASKAVQAVIKKQKDNGTWGGNLLGVAPRRPRVSRTSAPSRSTAAWCSWACPPPPVHSSSPTGCCTGCSPGTKIPLCSSSTRRQPRATRPYTLWARNLIREAATAALAEAGNIEDPRVRGAAHKIANEVSEFLRSPLAEKPFVRSGSATVLHPDAHPPDWNAIAMVAAMPNIQRERAGFTERLRHYLAQPAPKKAFALAVGKKKVKPTHLLLGDPIEADSKGVPKDLPLALHFLELLARIGGIASSANATRVLSRMLKDTDENGVWNPKGLRSVPKAISKVSYHTFPLDLESKAPEWRQVDVTFRLALITKLMGWRLEYV